MAAYAFITGRQPELSVAEILSRLRVELPEANTWNVLDANSEVLMVEVYSRQELGELFSRLGGSVKLVKVEAQFQSSMNAPSLASRIMEMLRPIAGDGRIEFGISAYGKFKPDWLLDLPKLLKASLAEEEISSRYIQPSDKHKMALSSVQSVKNALPEKGSEIVYLSTREGVYLGRTLQVQEFEEFSERDYGKPERRIDPGLLPPKLARILLNLSEAGQGAKILDPFCGSGVVLSEGALLGYSMTGMDIAPEALQASRANLEWLQERYPAAARCLLKQGDAREAVRNFGPFSFDAVVGEGDLGPVFSRKPTRHEVKALVKKYEPFYLKVLSELRSVVKPGGSVILAIPRWKTKEGTSEGLQLDYWIRLMGYRRLSLYREAKEIVPESWRRSPLVYQRPGQHTAREILCLKA